MNGRHEIGRTNPPAHVRAVMDAAAGPCPTCTQPRTAHGDRCPQGEIDRLRARVAELEESNRVILGRKTRLADEMAASEGVSNKLVAEADDARLSAERHAAELLGAVGAWVRTASRERDRATAAEAQVAAVRALHAPRTGLCLECMVPAPCPTVRALDAASTAESATHQPSAQVGTAANGANQPAVTDAMVRAAEVAYALHPGTPSGATRRESIRAALEAALEAAAPAETSPGEAP